MTRLILILMTFSVLLFSATEGVSADLKKGAEAAQRGDFASALSEWGPLADQGNAAAQYNLDSMYRRGDGVPQDYETAVKWYTLAAEQGTNLAQFRLGVMYDEGKGVPENDRTAVKWYTLAAEQGNASAQSNLT